VGFNQRHRTEYLYGSSDKVIAVAVTPEGRIAISGSVENTLKLWDLTIGTELKTLTGHTDYIKAIAITWDGPAGYGRDVTIAIWMLER
jgi:WD40 repeat protein